MNIKFQKVDWDDSNLMYVEFSANGQSSRWYPKWKEVDDILKCAWLTEGAFNNSRWRDYFDVIASEVTLRGLLRRLATNHNFSGLPAVDISFSKLFQLLRGVVTKGD